VKHEQPNGLRAKLRVLPPALALLAIAALMLPAGTTLAAWTASGTVEGNLLGTVGSNPADWPAAAELDLPVRQEPGGDPREGVVIDVLAGGDVDLRDLDLPTLRFGPPGRETAEVTDSSELAGTEPHQRLRFGVPASDGDEGCVVGRLISGAPLRGCTVLRVEPASTEVEPASTEAGPSTVDDETD
jgi:hypothetical protein